jgi:uncharacterized membrane protein (DUF485 family)
MYYGEPPTAAIVKPTWLALLLSFTIVIAYFGFILMVALAKPLLSTMLAPGVSLALVLAAGLLLFCILASFIFVIMENRKTGKGEAP